MAKNRNKGFSLIEIVISIAILTLLLTPIVRQLSNTMRTNRLAKEQQYANENAEYVVEYFSQNSIESLNADFSDEDNQSEGDSTKSSDVVYPTSDGMVSATRTCDIYEIEDDGSISSSPVKSNLSYTAYTYSANNVELGSRKTEYTRTIVLDDLALSVMSTPIEVGGTEYSYRVAYNLTSDDISAGKNDGWELTNEGSLVKYTEDTTTNTSYVSAIVCKRLADDFSVHGVTNPNKVDVGSLVNLESSKVAIVTGTATNFDSQASDQLYMLAMERMKEVDPERYTLEISNQDKDHSWLGSYGYINGLRKITKISVTDQEDADGKYYYISVDVVYQNTYKKNLVIGSSSSGSVQDTSDIDYSVAGYDHDVITYNVYAQKFYYEDESQECPAIYYEYQPFTIEADETTKSVEYAASEYIIIDSQVENEKIYFYKPVWDQVYRYQYPDGDYDDTSLIANGENVYYVLNESSDFADISSLEDGSTRTNTDKVNIYLAETATSKHVAFYTNIVKENASGKLQVDSDRYYSEDDGSMKDSSGSDFQFFTASSAEMSSKINESVVDFTLTSQTKFHEDSSNGNVLETIGDESSLEDRLFTITVTLEPVSENVNTVVFSGAKGEN